MTNVERNVRAFRGQLAQLLGITGWTQKELAKKIGCNPATITAIKDRPYAAEGRWILEIQGLLQEELRKLER